MLLIRYAELYPSGTVLDVRCRNGVIEEVGHGLRPLARERIIDAHGGALLPGLHDHHLHLFALAASRSSLACGPPAVHNRAELAAALTSAPGTGWIRGVGYHESVAGMLDQHSLDGLLSERPVRIQHRSGKLWFLNSAAADALDLRGNAQRSGVECDADDTPTGRLFRLDGWLREQLRDRDRVDVDIAGVSSMLASFGITGFTDASPGNDDAVLQQFMELSDHGDLQQRVRLMGNEQLGAAASSHPRVQTGELKILLDEFALPDLDDVIDAIARAHRAVRPVAIHCATPTELVFALAALRSAGPPHETRADRIEHASVTSADTLALIKETGATVVTQPILLADRGDQYLSDLSSDELDGLYRARSYLRRKIPFACSSDAPYGDPDPWAGIAAATTRQTASGETINGNETLTAEQSMDAYLAPLADPGGPARVIAPGEPADLCLLALPWRQAGTAPSADLVAATVIDGRLAFRRESAA